MGLLVDSLTLWEVAFRWEGLDPRRFWLRVPLGVQDHFRNLLLAILSAELPCLTICLEKRNYGPDDADMSVYHWIDDIHLGIQGILFNRKLLRHAVIERDDLKLWCERRTIPLPPFWFPEGWRLEYDLPDDEIHPGHYYLRKHWTTSEWREYFQQKEMVDGVVGIKSGLDGTACLQGENLEGPAALIEDFDNKTMRHSQQARIACQLIAQAMWKENPTQRISSLISSELIQKYGGGGHYHPDTVRDWVNKVAPREVRENRGRPRKTPSDVDSG